MATQSFYYVFPAGHQYDRMYLRVPAISDGHADRQVRARFGDSVQFSRYTEGRWWVGEGVSQADRYGWEELKDWQGEGKR